MNSGNLTVHSISLISIFDRYRAHFSNWNSICGAFTCIWCSVDVCVCYVMPCHSSITTMHKHINDLWSIVWVWVCVCMCHYWDKLRYCLNRSWLLLLPLPLEPYVKVYYFNQINRKRIFAFAIQTVWVFTCVSTHSIWMSIFLNVLFDQTERMNAWKKIRK